MKIVTDAGVEIELFIYPATPKSLRVHIYHATGSMVETVLTYSEVETLAAALKSYGAQLPAYHKPLKR